MKEHVDRDMPDIEKSSVIVEEKGKTEGGLGERDEGEDMMVDVVGADAVDLDSKANSVRLVEECMQKETETRDLNMDVKEEVAGSGEEDVCHDSVGTSVLTVEKVEVRDCEMDFESRGESQIGGGDIAVIDENELMERGSSLEQRVESVEECTRKEAEIRDQNMDVKEEVAGSGEDVCCNSVGSGVLAFENVEVTVNEEGLKTGIEVQDCEMSFKSKGEPQLGGGDIAGKEQMEKGSNMEQHVEYVEECMKETVSHDLNMDMEEAAASGEDVCHDSVGSGVVAFEKVEVTVIEEGLNTSLEVSKDVLQGNDATACGSLVHDSKESSIGGGDIVVIDNKDLTERGSTEEVVAQHVESAEEVADGDRMMDQKNKKEAENLDSSEIAESLKVDMIVVQDGFASKDEAKETVSVDPSLVSANNQDSSTELANVGTDEVAEMSKEESLHPKIEAINTSRETRLVGGENDLIDSEEKSDRGLAKEIMEQPMECDQQVGDEDCMVNEKIGKESEALGSSKISEPSITTNPGSEDVDVVVVEEGLTSKDEVQVGVSVDPSLVCADKVVNSATSEGDVIAQAENVDQQVEVIANDAQNLESGTGVEDSKSAVDTSSGEPQFGVETAVIDIEETEKGLTVEAEEIVDQHPESVQERIHGDDVMDVKTQKGDEVSDSSKIPESLTAANLGPEEVLTTKIEAQDGDSVGQRLVYPDNQSLSTENSDLRAEVGTTSKDESVHPTIEVASRTEVDEVTGSEKQKDLDSISDDSENKPSLHPDKVPTDLGSTPKPSFIVGEFIQRIASQLTGPGPPLVLKSNSDPDGQHVDQLVGPENSQGERTIIENKQSSVAEMLSQLHLVAQDPMKVYSFLNTIKPFFHDRRTAVGRPFSVRKRKTSNENEPEEFEFDDVNDSYWTDRIVQNHSEEQLLQENQNGGQEQHAVAYEPDKPAKAHRRSNKKRFLFSNHEMGLKEQSELVERRQKNLATEVVLRFPEGIYFPSEIHLNKMFRRFGALMESETEVDRQNGRARVVFKKCCDAEVAHSSAGKFNIFGSINVNYELNYTPLVSYKPLLLSVLQDSMDTT
ncbi:translocase of chloroplast 159, chloroplastic-like [Cynara cardunculus var. scolymus]|uniref:translocase of chloroplast 159, chloroplastic-like n=1 Tax=Cynara cardunculus var. scolymus TaxID=59895 RepID=UPI000D62CA98|nr:translocase of chloroplast 159, chloroplastic-like [Cynara cardunculus var. scolymus]XP_024960522.1 translocase of chloroplast 159, chloroplastic-like [Cynara cardunculus var. scolymus]